MKTILFLTIFLTLVLDATSTFITPIEYATQLYKNPRGIGCQHCHGENGEGKLIAKYKHKNIEKSFRGPAINQVEFKQFYNALNKRITGMPRYFLTKKEVQALYLHLHQDDKKESKNAH